MILTEDEAKTKWCPFARTGVYAGAGAVAINRHVDPEMEEQVMCKASGCMAWRLTQRSPEHKGCCGLASLA